MLAPHMIQDLDRAIEIMNKNDLTTIALQIKACELINKDAFTALLKEFQWSTNVSDVISQIQVAGSDNAKELAVIDAVKLFAETIGFLVVDLDETLDSAQLDAIWEKYENSEYEEKMDQYLESKLLYPNVEASLGTIISDIGVSFKGIAIKYLGGSAESIEINAQFNQHALEHWINEHTLVQDGHLVFVE